MILEFDNLP